MKAIVNKKEYPDIVNCESLMIWPILNEWRIKNFSTLKKVTINADRKLFSAFCRGMLMCGIATLKYEDNKLEIGLLEHTDLEKWDTNKIALNISVICNS